MTLLSAKQQLVLKEIRKFIKEHNQAPTVKELQKILLSHKFKANSTRTVVKYLNTLTEKGFIEKTGKKRGIKLSGHDSEEIGILRKIPILGTANAGQPVAFAEQEFQGYLPVSKTINIANNNLELYAIKVKGTSMNLEKINDGDYAIIDPNNTINFKFGKPHLFVIDNCATIKNFKEIDDKTVALMPNSTDEHTPIYLHSDDFDENFRVIGKVIFTLKGI